MIDSFLEVQLRRQLIDSVRRNDLARAIVDYAGSVMAAECVRLFVRDPGRPCFSCAAYWSSDGAQPIDHFLDEFNSGCHRCLAATTSHDLVIAPCSPPGNPNGEASAARYCAPLVFGKEVVAVLLIDLPANVEPCKDQVDALTRVLPDMSLAVANYQLQRSIGILADEAASTKRDFAQDLHDSLAHTIGYLRLKLDQLSMEGALLEPVESQMHIERMRDAANEAYEMIRQTLAELEPAGSSDLAESILEQATVIGRRAGIEVRMASSNEPIPVAPEVRRQVLYICREALNNTACYAQAHNADVYLKWGIDCLSLCIKDDGRGFNLDEVPLSDHFGLAIMKQRALSVGGTLSIRSAPGEGTQIVLWSPAMMTCDVRRQIAAESVPQGNRLNEDIARR